MKFNSTALNVGVTLKSSNRNWICKSAGITGGIIAINLSPDKASVQLELNFINRAAKTDQLRNIVQVLNLHRAEIEAKIDSALIWEDGQNRFVVRKNIPATSLVKNPYCWPALHKELVVWTERFKNCFIPLISECRWSGSLKSFDKFKETLAKSENDSIGEDCSNNNVHDLDSDCSSNLPKDSAQVEHGKDNTIFDLEQSEDGIVDQTEEGLIPGGLNE